jgi:hypothetical protein
VLTRFYYSRIYTMSSAISAINIASLWFSPDWTITISPWYTVEHGDFAVANCGVSLCVIGKLISRWTTMIAVDHRGLGGSRWNTGKCEWTCIFRYCRPYNFCKVLECFVTFVYIVTWLLTIVIIFYCLPSFQNHLTCRTSSVMYFMFCFYSFCVKIYLLFI